MPWSVASANERVPIAQTDEEATAEGGRSRLDNATKLVDRNSGHWRLRLYPDAFEASGSFRSVAPHGRVTTKAGEGRDPERSKAEAARRAAGQLRRYGVANRLNRLVSLTYPGEGCFDQLQFREDIAQFFRDLRAVLENPFPYAWVPEWHPGGHGLHAHVALGRYVRKSVIQEAWGHGFIDVRLMSYLPIGTGIASEALQASKYLAKYVRKGMDDERILGMHRYDVAEGFQATSEAFVGRNEQQLLDQATERMGAAPKYAWRSADAQDWAGPYAVWATWLG